jgi:hypothetical protein
MVAGPRNQINVCESAFGERTNEFRLIPTRYRFIPAGARLSWAHGRQMATVDVHSVFCTNKVAPMRSIARL